MCTLTLIPISSTRGCARMVFNRDEQHTRSPARPPSRHLAGDRTALLPRDADAGGTWIAASDAGLAFAVLNVNFATPPKNAGPSRSRGDLIPALLGLASLEEAVILASALNTEGMQPFRLVMTDGLTIAEFMGGVGHSRLVGVTPLTMPWMRCSSGLGDEHVQVPRAQLLREVFQDADAACWASLQDHYHAHRWPDAEHLSVYMTRSDARTVSRTTIELGDQTVSMVYEPEECGSFGPPVTAVLRRLKRLVAETNQ